MAYDRGCILLRDALVAKQAESDFAMIKVDLTKGDNPVHERLLQ